MKHLIKFLFAAIALTAFMSSCAPDDVDPPVGEKTLTLTSDKDKIVADGEDMVTFTVKYGEDDVTSYVVIKQDGAEIDGNTFTVAETGTYKFTAHMYDGQTSNEITVTATEPGSGLTLSVDKNEIAANGTDAATFTVKYGETDVTSSAVIRMNGTAITGNTFTASETGDYKFTAEHDGNTSNEVTVTAVSAEVRVVLSHATTTRARNITFTLRAVVLPASTENKDLTWSSSNTTVATVDAATGVITTLNKSGVSTITATMVEGGKTAECVLTVEKTCNANVPGWGADGVGTAGFRSDKTWVVEGKEWSDAVVTSKCSAKTTFAGGSEVGNYNAECRNNPGYGDMFTWCAVIRFQDELCPDGWRVPSLAEFQELDVIFGGTGTYRSTTIEELNATYLSPEVWGGQFNGGCGVDMAGNPILYSQGENGFYWAATEYSLGNGYGTYFSDANDDWGDPALVQPDSFMNFLDAGQGLRCVKTI